MQITFTYITSVNSKELTKTITAADYKTAVSKFEAWATQTHKNFAIIAEAVA